MMMLCKLSTTSCQHTVPAQKSNISKKIIGGRSLTFSFMKIICNSYFLPGYHITLHHKTGLQTTHYRSTSSKSRQHFSRFGQQDLYLPPMIENLLIYFFQYRPFGRGVPWDRQTMSVIELSWTAKKCPRFNTLS